MDTDGTLLTIAEIAIAYMGFAALIATLRRPLSTYGKVRLISLLLASLLIMSIAFAPTVLGSFSEDIWADSYRWALGIWMVYSIAVLPVVYRGGRRMWTVINVAGSVFAWGIFFGFAIHLVLGAFGWVEPSFHFYASGLIALLAAAGVTFMDVAIADDL